MKWIIILLIYSFSTASFTVKSFAQKSTDIQVFSDAEKRKFDYYFYEALNSKVLGKYDEAIDYLDRKSVV